MMNRTEYQKKYRERNSDKLKKYLRDYYLSNIDKLKLKRKKWREDNREDMSYRRREKRKADPRLHLLKSAKARAVKRNMQFSIEITDLEIPPICPVLGIPMQVGGHAHNSPSIDRIDNDIGYVRGNIRVISYRANWIKSNATPEELVAVAKYAIDNQF